MSKGTKLLGIALLASVALAGMAADTPSQTMGKVRTVEFITAVKVGGVLLPAGEYKVQELMDGDSHLLAFKTMNDKEKVRVHCNLVELPNKVAQTEQGAQRNDAGERILHSLAFKGEKARHEIANQ
ncbi:MAG: hypothetical protein LAN64_01035 [Acidobacteriia bacterium]|nr:hypothetical protein [Terriglobia bacterium]